MRNKLDPRIASTIGALSREITEAYDGARDARDVGELREVAETVIEVCEDASHQLKTLLKQLQESVSQPKMSLSRNAKHRRYQK